MENVVSVDFTTYPFILRPSYSDEIQAKSVIVATGARANWLGLHNEERLAHSGGGDTAMEEANYLTKFAGEVVIIHRRDEFRASRIMAERTLANPKIRVEWNAQVTEVLGDDFITGLRLQDTVTGEERELEVGGLFVAIGHTPNTAFLGNAVQLTPHGYIVAPHPWRTATNVEGVFAAGDVMDDYYRQAITAAGTGCMAALEAERWLAHHGVQEAEPPVLETAESSVGHPEEQMA